MSHGGLKRARSWKRRIPPKEAYSSPGLLYSEACAIAWLRSMMRRRRPGTRRSISRCLATRASTMMAGSPRRHRELLPGTRLPRRKVDCLPSSTTKWELYNVSEDFSEASNIAAQNPVKLKEMQDLFWKEAEKYNVLPIENSRINRFDVNIRPSLTRGREEFTYYADMVRIPEGAAPDTKNKSWQIKAEVVVPKGGAEGMLITHGGRFSGWGLYVLNGKLVFCYNLAGVARYYVASKDKLAPGPHTVVYDFKYDGPGLGKGGVGAILVDGKTVATGRIDRTLAFRLSLDETLDCGEDTGTPVTEDYQVPFKFTGQIKKVVIDLTPSQLSAEDEAKMKEAEAAIAAAK